jgi:uncharacterized protein YbjT (DUF2867 family)
MSDKKEFMNIVVGATGHVGNAVVEGLLSKNAAVRGIIRDPEKAHALAEKGAQAGIADGSELNSLATSFKDGTAVFLITPESVSSNDVFGDAEELLKNYREAIEQTGIKKIVGLSSIGAHHDGDTGNLEVSRMLEHAFEGLNAQQIFVRPAYYFSNWLPYLETVKESGVLPTFYPVDQKISMCSPDDVGEFVSGIMIDDNKENKVYELLGPTELSSADVAAVFSQLLDRPVEAKQIPDTKWGETMENVGFSIDATEKFIAMTQMVIDGKTQPEGNGTEVVTLKTSFADYLKKAL